MCNLGHSSRLKLDHCRAVNNDPWDLPYKIVEKLDDSDKNYGSKERETHNVISCT